MTVVATVLDVNTPANTLILTSVDLSQNITLTTDATGDGVIDGDVLSAALSAATLSPSGKETKYGAATVCTKESGTDNVRIDSESTTDEVTVTFVTSVISRRVNAEELRKAIANVLND